MTKEEILSQLLDLGVDLDSTKGLKKAELEKMLLSASSASELLEDVEVSDTEASMPSEDEPDANVGIFHPDWTEFALSSLTDKEKVDGNPRVDGLRRLAGYFFGWFSTHTEVVASPSVSNAGRATVVVTLTFHQSNRTVCGAADVYSGNTGHPYYEHAVATAESRAEGRALRKALYLTSVLSAEEVEHAPEDDEAGSKGAQVPTSMLNSLQIMCAKHGVDLFKLAVKMGYDITHIDELTKGQALNISNQLFKYTSGEEIPNEVK